MKTPSAGMMSSYAEEGLIRSSQSSWSSSLVLIKRKHGELRICCDYRRLNAVNKRDCYPLSQIDDNLVMLSQRRYFSKLDLLSGYFQIEMSSESVEASASATPYGLYEWADMP